MSLRKKQSEFARAVGLLLNYIYFMGYEVTFGEAQAFATDKRHIRGSFHYKRLAIDLNLFKDGNYLRSTKAHEPFGIFWESLGGTWGGRFRDGNHYSWGE